MRKFLYILVSFLVLVVVIIKITVPNLIQKKIKHGLFEMCPKCDFEVGSTSISLLTSKIILHDVSFVGDPNDSTTVDFKVDIISFKIQPASLKEGNGPPHLDLIEIVGLKINARDDDAKPPSPPSKLPKDYHWIKGLPPVSIHEINVFDSQFNYFLKTNSKLAKLSVYKVVCKISSFGSRENISPRYVYFDVDAVLEQSGIVKLKGQEDLFGVPNEDKLFIEVKNQKLSELNRYFSAEDEVELDGVIEDIVTDVKISEGQMRGILKTQYSGLSIKMLPAPDQGGLKRALVNFVSSVTIIKERPKEKEEIPTANVNIDRKPHQGLIKFLLTGFKEAAFSLVQNKKKN